MIIQTIGDFRKAICHGAYAWPGGYPVFFLMSDGGALAYETAKTERRSILEALRDNDRRSGWLPIALEVNWEDANLFCAHSGEAIESAYDCEVQS